jgi:hypothetical protein
MTIIEEFGRKPQEWITVRIERPLYGVNLCVR